MIAIYMVSSRKSVHENTQFTREISYFSIRKVYYKITIIKYKIYNLLDGCELSN